MDDNALSGTTFPGEYGDVADVDEDIRQGDVLDLIPEPGVDEPWAAHFGIVLTANCDLVHRKHGGVLSYVPVVPVEVYTSEISLPRLVEGEVVRTHEMLESALPTDAGWPTFERLIEMLEIGHDPSRVLEALPDSPERDEIGAHVGRVSLCLQARSELLAAAGLVERLAIAERLRVGLREIDGSKRLPPFQNLIKEVKGRLVKSLPGDSLYLGRLSKEHQTGYVAYLRLIREISHDTIARSAVEEGRLGQEARARRLSRLNLLYQHRLAQQMSRVFVDIGLPADYEAAWAADIEGAAIAWHNRLENTDDSYKQEGRG